MSPPKMSLVVTNCVLSFPTGYLWWDLGLNFVSVPENFLLTFLSVCR